MRLLSSEAYLILSVAESFTCLLVGYTLAGASCGTIGMTQLCVLRCRSAHISQQLLTPDGRRGLQCLHCAELFRRGRFLCVAALHQSGPMWHPYV